MEKTKNMFLTSAKELKTTSTLAVCAMLAALALILNSVASINIGPYVKIGFSGIPNQIADYLFGPITGCLFAGVLDIVKFFIRPDGPFFFGFTFNAMLAAFIYGCFYYKHKLTFRRVLICKTGCRSDCKCSVKYLMAGHALRKRIPCNPPNAYCKELDHVAN